MRTVLVFLLIGCASSGVRPRDVDGGAGSDAGAFDASPASDAAAPLDGASALDAGSGALTLALTHAEDACSDLAVPHAAPQYLLRFDATGPRGARVRLWADKPDCGVAPFVYRELDLDASGHARADVTHGGTSACGDSLLGHWRAWLELGGARSNVVDGVIRSSACMGIADCSAARGFCPSAALDGGVAIDAGPPPAAADELVRRDGDFFTPTATAPKLHVDTTGNGTIYARVEVDFDFVSGDWQPELPDEGNIDRTEHILFGLFRANQRQTNLRYLMGAAAVTFASRSPHLRMFGRTRITNEGYITYTEASASYGWARGVAYHLHCSLDGITRVQLCELTRAGGPNATRTLEVAYLEPAMHLASGFYVEIGQTPDDYGIETSPMGWTFSNLVVRGIRRD